MKKKTPLKLVVLIGLLLISTALFSAEELSVGSKAPDFTLPVLGKEKPVSLSDYINKKIVIVHFWKSR